MESKLINQDSLRSSRESLNISIMRNKLCKLINLMNDNRIQYRLINEKKSTKMIFVSNLGQILINRDEMIWTNFKNGKSWIVNTREIQMLIHSELIK